MPHSLTTCPPNRGKAKFSKKAKIRHQIILATSMVDPSLETDEFCIGPVYELHNKTLQFPNKPAAS